MTSLIELVAEGSKADIHPGLGGRLGQLDLGDGPLLRPNDGGLSWDEWGCFPLVPWSNRLPGGQLRYGRLAAQLPVNHPDGSAIHGSAASCPWVVDHQDECSALLSVEVEAGPYEIQGYLSYQLSPGTLDIVLGAVNLGSQPVPVGIGIHPWFQSGPVRVPAECVWPGEPLPTGSPLAVSGRHDLRQPSTPEPMDACFTDLTAAEADVPGARLSWSGPITNVVVYSGQAGWVCVEPVTMANNGIAMADQHIDGHGVIDLAPAQSVEVRYRFDRREVVEGP